MYCKNCGKFVDDNSIFCSNCGTRFDNGQTLHKSDDRSSFGFAILGFFIPLVGLILFLVYEGEQPKRAKSAGRGALIGFITKIVISIICIILYVVFTASIFENVINERNELESSINELESGIPAHNDILDKDNSEEILAKYADVTFGEFSVSDNGYYSKTELDVTVKNKAETRYTYFITIEAVDSNGARIDTDMIYADRLNAGQEIHLTAFEYVEQDKIELFKNATFKVLEIDAYNY